ncbi:heterokaryon incompatibility protein-domain-containing protein [Diplogelasinospora grovesii]|uniref:Heterokaryon incompatibility protein-domain-containing protein n=1 Tax=Diplogelasinospora grovesii TaxID=303347 RepID=A0AAN6S5P8_9PEZI|nr:heterokaryon incompatibility protein-domain-containing protein [Diplogelasinospora grovesii]
MPKRLLELTRVNDSDPDSDEVSVRLVQDLETKEPYVCLTHRWGPTTPGSRTLQANLAERLGERGTLWESLPKTFQEAAIVTLYLGVRYIWIDSLCIIQDSAEDWKQQSALMCSIYNGARLTIAAAWADDCSRGLFRRPAPRSWEVAVPSAVGGDSPPRRYLFRRTPEHPVWDAKGAFMLQKETPLLSRSWVFQERLLSRRVVYFTRYEVVFECGVESGLTNDRGVKCQCGTNEFGHYGGGGLGSGEGGMGWRPKGDHLAALQVGKEFKGPGSDFAEISRYWHHMVSVYSGLDITKATDRLPAIGGIARQYGDAHAEHLGRYIAGTWENCLPHSLLWSCRGRPHGGDAPTHEAEYVGPTWSWISVRDQVDFSTGVARVYKDDLEIVGHHVHAEKGADQYGAILEGAALDCKAYLAPGTLEIEADDVDDARYRFIGAGECEQRFEPDRPLSRYVSLGSQIFCMKTGYVWDGKHLCLILRRLETGDKGGSEIGLGGTFERIGLVKNASKENIGAWFAGTSEKRTIRLV